MVNKTLKNIDFLLKNKEQIIDSELAYLFDLTVNAFSSFVIMLFQCSKNKIELDMKICSKKQIVFITNIS